MRLVLTILSFAASLYAYEESAWATPKPTATEVFHLRAECIELAGGWLQAFKNGTSGPSKNLKDYVQTYHAKYDEDTNRCFVEVKSSYVLRKEADNPQSLPGAVYERLLLDVQTGNQVAVCYKSPFGSPSFGNSTPLKPDASPEVACAFIDKIMRDDFGEAAAESEPKR